MDILVLAKYVPNIERIPATAWDLEKGTLIRGKLQMHFNSYDQVALNMALHLKKSNPEVKITVISMGPPSAKAMLKEAIAYGADKAILLSDKAFAGADTIATAYTIAQAIKNLKLKGEISDQYCVFCGMQSPDGDTAQVPAQVAQFLGAPLYPYVADLKGSKQDVEFTCLNTVGSMSIKVSQFPFVATATKLYKKVPFYVGLTAMIKANNAEVTTYAAADLNCDSARIGLQGSRTRVIKVFQPEKKQKEQVVLEATSETFAMDLNDLLNEQAEKLGGAAIEVGNQNKAEAIDTEVNYYQGACISLCELQDGKLSASSYETSSRCAEIAQQLKEKAEAIVCSEPNDAIAKELARYGITHTYFITGIDPKVVCVHNRARAIAALIKNIKPQIVIASATLTGRVIAPYISAELNGGLTADCSELEIKNAVIRKEIIPNILHQTRPALGGNIMATITSIYDKASDYIPPQMATVRPGVLNAQEYPVVNYTTSQFKGDDYFLQWDEKYVLHPVAAQDEQMDINQFDVLVCVGRGVADKSGIDDIIKPFISKLEKRFNTKVGLSCTRAIVDEGIMSHNHQIGQTGIVVKPKLYIGIGVSGAIQHKIGMENAETIISVNSNSEAPLNTFSDYVVLGDYETVLSKV